MKRPSSSVLLAIVIYAALGLVAWAVTWLFGIPLAARLRLTTDVAWRCAWGLFPMAALLAVAMRSQWPPLLRLRELVAGMVQEFLADANVWQLGMVAAAAGAGEELLFRGALQPLAERWFGALAGLIVASVLFGAVHALSVTYFVLATGVGLYLGWLAQHFNDLVAPIFLHAAYDWAALVALTVPAKHALSPSPREGEAPAEP